MGASRILAELAIRVQLDHGTVVRATVGDGGWSGLDTAIRALLAMVGDRWPGDGADAAVRRRALAPLLLGKSDPADDRSRWGTAEAATQLALAAAAERPVAILIDDVHRASGAALDVLAYLARAAADQPLLVVLGGRKSHVAGDPTARLGAMVRGAARALRLELAPLDRGGILELATAAIGRPLAERLVDDLVRACGGNPGHALRALESMAQQGQLRRVHGAWDAEGALVVPMPPAVLDAARARLGRLPVASRAVLRAAAATGDEFDRVVVGAALGVALGDEPLATAGDDRAPPPAHPSNAVPETIGEEVVAISVSVRVAVPSAAADADDAGSSRRLSAVGSIAAIDAALAEAVAARLLSADPAAGTFRFAHPELARSLAGELAPDERHPLQRRAALALAARRDPPAAQLTRLAVALGDRAMARRWGAAAADAADAAGDPEAALEYAAIAAANAPGAEAAALTERVAELAARTGDVERALALYPKVVTAPGVDADTRIRAALAQAELERRRGKADVAHGVLMQALAAARAEHRPAAEARCHLRIGWVLMYRADYKAATEHAIAGLVIARTVDDRQASAELSRLAAAVAIYQGDAKRALDLLDDALTDASATDDAKLRAGVLHEIGRASIHAGDYARAQTALEAAIAAADDAGDVEQRAKSLNNYGAASYFRGDWPRARRAWEQFRQLCERMGDHAEMLFALNNLGALYRELGMLADARAALDRAADVAADTGQGHIAAMVLANRGEVEMRDGDLAGARERYERALVEFVRLGAKADVIETRRRLCELDLVVGRIDEALSRAIDTARDARDAGIKLEEGILHRVAAQALRMSRDLDSARWFLDRARELLIPLDARYELGKVAAEEAELARAGGDDPAAEVGARAGRGDLRPAERPLGSRSGPRPPRAARADRSEQRPQRGVLGRALRDVGGADVERLLARALDRILAASGYERGFVLLLDNDGRPREHLRRTRPGVRTFDRGDAEFSGTIARRVAASGQAAAVGDAALDADLREQRSVIALGLRRIMCAPLRVGGRVIGIVYVDSSQIAVDERALDLAALDAIAGPLALAIENARLVADSKHKTELMSILAHEIRNPLAGILGYSEMGADPEFAGELGDARELLGRIRHDAERLRRLVDNVLELARHESDNVDWSMTAVDVGALAADVAENYRPVCEKKRIALTVLGRDDAGAALGNTDRLAQVLSNLLGNAVKFTPDGGAITITVHRESVRVDDPNAPRSRRPRSAPGCPAPTTISSASSCGWT